MLLMFYAITAIGLMFAANIAIITARKTLKPLLRIVLYVIAAASLIGAFLFILAVLSTF